MAVGDRIPTELAQSALSATATNYFTNAGSSYRTQILEVCLVNTGSSQRVVTLYKNGLAANNQVANSITLPASTSTIIDLKLVATGVQTFGANQDSGIDVTMTVSGIVEQIA